MSTVNRTLLIVTCERDKWKFEMLCRSIKFYLEPCKIMIVYNGVDTEYKHWIRWLNKLKRKLLYRFDVIEHPASKFWPTRFVKDFDIEDLDHGWISQQMLKILVADYIGTTDYLILDSKNFFFKPCNIANIKSSRSHGNWTTPFQDVWTEKCCKTLDLIYPGRSLKLRANVTPYIFKTDVAKQLINYLGGPLEFHTWFLENGPMAKGCEPAEFILYELFEVKVNQRDAEYVGSNGVTVWRHMLVNDTQYKDSNVLSSPRKVGEYILEEHKTHNITVSGFHKGAIMVLSYDDILTILKVLDAERILPVYTPAGFL